MELKFDVSHSEAMGVILIEGIAIPHYEFDPLAKIWADLRKRAHAKYGIDISAAFFYDDAKKVVSCNFWLNYAAIENSKNNIGVQTYTGMFVDRFDDVAGLFQATVVNFVNSYHYDEYCRLAQMSSSKQRYKTLLNEFLVSVGLRKPH